MSGRRELADAFGGFTRDDLRRVGALVELCGDPDLNIRRKVLRAIRDEYPQIYAAIVANARMQGLIP